MLIVTLPAVYEEKLLRKIIAHPLVDGVRYNTGMKSPYSAQETLRRIQILTTKFRKQFWIDLKGRQLRIKHWAVPQCGDIVLNHRLKVDCPARVFFRGDNPSTIRVVRGDTIYVDPPPTYAVGEGQAINVEDNNLEIEGYSIDTDRDYVATACELGIFNFMLSFVELADDVTEIREIVRNCAGATAAANAEFVLKIESPRGLKMVQDSMSEGAGVGIWSNCNLMAARDDLMINVGDDKWAMIDALKLLIARDPKAIVASRIFHALKTAGEISMADMSDVYLMYSLGYRNFMFCDGISQKYFDKAIKGWQGFRAMEK